ncbi:diadenylate cyclase CdaA [Candidatus Synechococcus calcipolaris G9]|uniref:Diadenylate cyclase n=1 Tax=Candidatus Synechococcus calcipolaris G9 TaxID=1497997 RepID=A0ABT6EZJ7_9SYNE|nr:diadenylate cyclase CdaA [Candidatus Synechococcus calcipolaris]MDG2991030.1 diadenylate cyclase CdaA [Candidatus Synechococcus calcipolaris G9]
MTSSMTLAYWLWGFTWPVISTRTWVLVRTLADVGLVLALTYIVLLVIAERRTLWMVRGFIFLIFAASLSNWIGLKFLAFVLNNLVVGSAVALAVILQPEIRYFLEQLGRGKIFELLRPPISSRNTTEDPISIIVAAVKDLSQNRTGALILLETNTNLTAQDFTHAGVRLNAALSKELIHTIFQTSSPLHDGAILIRGSQILAAKLILPLSERTGPWQLGTRHRAAIGMTERFSHCLCVVVSEETGSISLAIKGELQRPLTSSKLGELLEQYLKRNPSGTLTSSPRRFPLKFLKMVWPLR